MKKFTLKLNHIAMGYLSRWVMNAISELDDDAQLLEKLVIADLYYRHMQKFHYPDKTSLRLALHEALALSVWLDSQEEPDPYANIVLLQIYELVTKPLNEQLCRIKKRRPSTARTAYAG